MKTGWLLVLVGAVLLLDPRCDRGCHTIAEHLLVHGLKSI